MEPHTDQEISVDAATAGVTQLVLGKKNLWLRCNIEFSMCASVSLLSSGSSHGVHFQSVT